MKEKWTFPYTADILAEAAKSKLDHHNGRFTWWTDQYNLKFNEIKTKGLNVHESVGANSSLGSFTSTYNMQPTISIDAQLTNEFNECQRKVAEHRNKIADYNAWHQVLMAQGKSSYDLLHTDWLFFFGK